MRARTMVVLAGILAGCGGESADTPDTSLDDAMVAAPAIDYVQAVRMAGVLMLGENSSEFLPCGDGPELWLDGPLSLDLIELHDEMTPGVEPFEGIFIDVVADIDPPPATGPGRVYPGSLIVEFLRRAAFEGWNCGDVGDDVWFAADGTEPFWSLEVTEAGAVFTTPDGGARALALGEIRMEEEGWVVPGADPESGVEVRLIDAPCRNAMSGAFSHLMAQVTIGDVVHEGCGWFGPAADPDAA